MKGCLTRDEWPRGRGRGKDAWGTALRFSLALHQPSSIAARDSSTPGPTARESSTPGPTALLTRRPTSTAYDEKFTSVHLTTDGDKTHKGIRRP
ncbi:Hypothetical protein NTJ_06275 [Nesidiocoris tenuis]|uniref:Uncharacterized protein n=1 Tax=Nesidiocoris tenuis TaxID=355587 RepID=A0ABN7ARD5_9HEMI|nr:Hypothetical protein NTJ_06275 [Nesidiocoris tenuis]